MKKWFFWCELLPAGSTGHVFEGIALAVIRRCAPGQTISMEALFQGGSSVTISMEAL